MMIGYLSKLPNKKRERKRGERYEMGKKEEAERKGKNDDLYVSHGKNVTPFLNR